MPIFNKSPGRREPTNRRTLPRSTAPVEQNTHARRGGAWGAGVPLGVELPRYTMSRPSLRSDVSGFRCFLNIRQVVDVTTP